MSDESAQLYVYAGSVLLATVIQLLLPVPWLRGLDGRLQLVIDWRDPAVRRFFTLMLPVTLTLGLINVNAVIDTLFASRLLDPDLAPAAIDKAFRLYMLPQGMFSVAVVTVMFPTLSRLAARGDTDGFRATVSVGMRQIAFLLVPASIVSAILAVPIVRLVYERGQFTAPDVTVVASCLAAFSLGLVFNGWMLLLTRGFYSLQSNWIPTTVAVATVLLNAALDAVLYRLGVWGIPLATALVNIVGVTALLVALRRRFGHVDGARVADAVARIAVASLLLGAVAFGAWYGLDSLLGRSLPAQIVSLGAALGVGLAVYLGACRVLKVRELDTLRSMVRGRSVLERPRRVDGTRRLSWSPRLPPTMPKARPAPPGRLRGSCHHGRRARYRIEAARPEDRRATWKAEREEGSSAGRSRVSTRSPGPVGVRSPASSSIPTTVAPRGHRSDAPVPRQPVHWVHEYLPTHFRSGRSTVSGWGAPELAALLAPPGQPFAIATG